MILLCGLRATGKTTVCRLLEEEGFWCFDTGPFWRSFREFVAPGMKVGELHFKMREYTGDPHWEDNFLSAVIRNGYEHYMKNKKDLVLSGYRNVEEALYIASRLEGIYPGRTTSMLYIQAPMEITIERYKKREGLSARIEDLIARHEDERQRGVERFRDIAHFVIDNSYDQETLKLNVQQIAYEQLGYPRINVEGESLKRKERE